jgi:hypothetical protein
MRYLSFILALALALPGHAQKIKPRKIKAMTTTQAPVKGAAEPVLVVQRTPCHGTCPTYKAAIYADGRVEYEGERFVNRMGKHTLRLPVTTVNQMLTEAKRINFNSFRAQYVGDVYDLPSTIVTVQPVGQPAKKVEARQDIPEKLQAYLDYLTKQLDPLANGLEEK